MRNELLERLVTDDDPVPAAWDALWDVWSPAAADLSTHYDREQESLDTEWKLYNVYEELFTEVLPNRCVREPSLSVPEDGALLMMDAMSVREAPLFADALRDAGFDVSVGFDYATVPSETQPFRDRVDYASLRRKYESTSVSSVEPSLAGDERVVWSRYPDALAENIQEGQTEIGSIEETYRKTEDVLLAVVSQLDADRVVIRSDHGYGRFEAGFGFPVSDATTDRLQALFSGGRSVDVGEADDSVARELVEDGVVVESDGWYLPVGRYTWPARGKFSTYQHGGLGLTEVLTPELDVQ
ncbi:MAG: alkaline phosphatase [Halobaculum sp.]